MSFDVCPASDYISQEFGCTTFPEWTAPWCSSRNYHSGIDLGSTTSTLFRKPVFATRAGTVVAVGVHGDTDWGFWNYLGAYAVCLKTHDAYLLYGHLDSASVTVGQVVQPGAELGLVGSRGNSTGPHLHYEARTDGARQNVWGQASAVLDPRPYLNKLTGGTAGSEVQVPQEDVMEDGDLIAFKYLLQFMMFGSFDGKDNGAFIGEYRAGRRLNYWADNWATLPAHAEWVKTLASIGVTLPPAPAVDVSKFSTKGHSHVVEPDV